MLKLSPVIGHRGAASYAPENTLEGFATAADMGVEWVECDVKLTRDGVPVLFHDEELSRTTNGSGLMAETDYDDLKALECGSWFSDSFAGIQIPTLEEAVEVLLQHNLGLNLEIKPCPGREAETASVALDILSQIWDDHDRLLISSFKPTSLETARDLASDWTRGLLLEGDIDDNWAELADYLDVRAIICNGNKLTKAEAEMLLEAEMPLLSYTINDPIRARELQRWGIDAIITDSPDIILENLLTTH
ncbi:MAG: glycerophosphoryl diester phosphodiesterase [Pseudobdellovibrionaceae bacterium]